MGPLIGLENFLEHKYNEGFIKGYIEGFSEVVAKKFEKLIAEELTQKADEMFNNEAEENIKEFMNKVSDCFYYFYDVIPKEKIKTVENSDKTE